MEYYTSFACTGCKQLLICSHETIQILAEVFSIHYSSFLISSVSANSHVHEENALSHALAQSKLHVVCGCDPTSSTDLTASTSVTTWDWLLFEEIQ